MPRNGSACVCSLQSIKSFWAASSTHSLNARKEDRPIPNNVGTVIACHECIANSGNRSSNCDSNTKLTPGILVVEDRARKGKWNEPRTSVPTHSNLIRSAIEDIVRRCYRTCIVEEKSAKGVIINPSELKRVEEKRNNRFSPR